jgi:putative phosphoesterase
MVGQEARMSDAKPTVWPFDGTKIAVLADCHIHPGGGPAFPPALFEHLDAEDPDLIVTLGDMGESAGLDELAEFAPVIGVRGQDDSDDPRTDNQYLLLKTDRFDIGCVFDAKSAGLAISNDPFEAVGDVGEVSERLFGMNVDVLLHASTHKPAEVQFGESSALNPGSAVLPAEGCEPSFLLLTVAYSGVYGHIVRLT